MDHRGGAATESGDSSWRSRWATMLGPGVVIALTLVGHELLFLILPLYAADFGLSLAWAGVVLASNRLIRVVGYGWVVALGRRIGPRDLLVAALRGRLTRPLRFLARQHLDHWRELDARIAAFG